VISVLDDLGTLQAVIEDYQKRKLPRMLRIRQQVDGGAILSEYDMEFLMGLHHQIYRYESFVEEHAEYMLIYQGFVQVYGHIIDVGLANERSEFGNL